MKDLFIFDVLKIKKLLLLIICVAVLVSGCTASGSTIVYVTATGTHYHTEDCQYLRDSKIEVSLKIARKSYAPCEVCKPPK
ncbi:MAG: hypothetical protein LBN00_03715 [Oscillospiraceae bacterium]|jgi:hypothetical protein|nr:hypothetical protein [Oscillospiraceae bacterium]